MFNKIKATEKNVWGYSLQHLGAFLLFLVLFDLGFGALLHHYYFKIKSGQQYRTTYAIEQTTADMIVFGSSRAVHHYYPDIFEDSLKVSFYNAGRDGEEACLYHYAVLKAMLKRYTPKIVVLDVMYGELGNTLFTYDRLAPLAPYYDTHPEMRPIINLRSDDENIRRISSIYPFNSQIMSIISGNLDKGGKKIDGVEGYLAIPSSHYIQQPIETIDRSKLYEVDSIKINVLKQFINECLQSKVKLYLVCSPYFEKTIGTDYSISLIKKMAADHRVDFFDFSQEPILRGNAKLFADAWHLNDSGAKIFSPMLAGKIKAVQSAAK